MLREGEVFAGYRIQRQLGQGGMGSVYLAAHPRLPRSTALKLLNRELFADNEIRARFEREADLVAQLDHPNIVTVFDRGVEDDQLWISMQYIDGTDAGMIDPRATPPERAVQIVEETAKALDFAHSMGVLHRDVKPANILLAHPSAGQNRVYLTDFGIARLRDDAGHLTQTGTFTATLAYASPEQLTGAPMDGRADQYALACTLFWLLTGTSPYESANPAAVIQGHLQAVPPRVTALRPDLPPALDDVLTRALAKRREDRFGSCTEFAEATRAVLGRWPGPPLTPSGPRPVVTPAPWPGPPPTPSGPRPVVTPAPIPVMPPHGIPAPAPSPVRPPYGYRPPARRRSVGLSMLVMFAVLLVVIVGGALGVRAVYRHFNPDPPYGAIAEEFPKMIPAERGGLGYLGARCFPERPEAKQYWNSPSRPDLGAWTAGWSCDYHDGSGNPHYFLFVYGSPSDVLAATSNLKKGDSRTEINAGTPYTNYYLAGDGSTTPRMVTTFHERGRDRFLMYTVGSYGEEDKLAEWWNSAPLK
ncbi:serine/threonine-protein kinase [Nocardia amikacinitolerans]|uniref:serine/threonine-protein kinase n=1 Tax=Nocardia amikacinitolerans TaxID=756689 RepID=UPI0020A5914F|nr:serine/threonine-protein kinase [Nocardia amikacinitolerans]MCP2292475.1 serine/threonine protein kinase [Nocardia amikacinitolerans]